MTIRTDITQDWSADPRISTIADPSVLYLVQDLVDTTRFLEETFRGMSEPRLLDACGKEDLGGGTLNQITASFQNNVVEFEARRTPAIDSTITTQGLTDARGRVQLVDSVGGFVAANIQPGTFCINFSDQSITDVRRVVGDTQLECKALVNGTGNTFEVGDVYMLFNIIQCEILGGNTVAVDEGDIVISPILPSAFTQIVLGGAPAGSHVAAFWDALVADHVVSGSFGEWVGKKLLSVVKFLGLK